MLRDFVGVATTPPGTNTSITLGAPLAGFRAFSAPGAFVNGNACFYYLSDGNQIEWGVATLASGSPDTLTGRTPIGNSAGTTARLNFTSAATYCYNALPSARAIFPDANNNVALPGALTATSATLTGAMVVGNAGAYQINDTAGTPRTVASGSGGVSRFYDSQNAGYVSFTNQTGSVEWGRIIGGIGWTVFGNNVPIVGGYDTSGAGQEMMRLDSGNGTAMRIPGTGTYWRVVNHAYSRELFKIGDSGDVTHRSFDASGWAFTESGGNVNISAQAINLIRTGSLFAFYQFNGATVGSISTNGSSTSYNTTSDYRLKILHGDTDAAFVERIPIYNAAWKDHPDVRYPMLVAHELAEVASWAVYGEKDATHPISGKIEPQQVSHAMLVPALIARLQHRGRQIEAQEARLASLEREVARLSQIVMDH